MSFDTNLKNIDIANINNNYIVAFKAILHSRGIANDTITIIANAEVARINAQTTAMINAIYSTISSQLLQKLKVTLPNVVTNVSLNGDGSLNVSRSNLVGTNTIIS